MVLADLPPAGVDGDAFGLTMQFLILAILVVLSGLFSGSETVLFSLTPNQLLQSAASTNPFRRMAAQLMQNPKRTLMTVLLGNTAVNVALYANTYVLTTRLEPMLGALVTPVGAVLSVLVVLVGGEVAPKVLAVTLAERLAPACAALVHFTGYVLAPLGTLIDLLLVEPLTRVLFGQRARQQHAVRVSTQELKSLLELNRRRGVIDQTEGALLREVIDLGQLRVADVMRPRVEVTACSIDDPPEMVRELMKRTRETKIPVYRGTIDEVVGFIYAKVLFFHADLPLSRQQLTPARFVPELINCEQLLRHFRETRSQIAVAVDERGDMAGVVTLEDVLEQIVGDVYDPVDQGAPEFEALSESEYRVSGRMGLHYWTETFNLPPMRRRISTVGGLIVAQLGRTAEAGDRVRLGNVELTVTSLRGRRVDQVHVRVLGDSEEEALVAAGAGR